MEAHLVQEDSVMNTHIISGSLSPEDKQKVMEAIATIHALMPYLKSLSKQQRKRLPKLGSRGRGFIVRMADLTKQHADLLPRSFDPEAFLRDAEFFKDMEEITIALTDLTEQSRDSTCAIGSDLYKDSLTVYSTAKISGKEAGIKESLSNAGVLFEKNPKTKKPEDPPSSKS